MQHANPSVQMHAKQILSVQKHAYSNSLHRSHEHSPSAENSASSENEGRTPAALYTTMRTKCGQHEVEGRTPPYCTKFCSSLEL